MLAFAILLLSCSQLASQIFLPVLPQIAKDLSLSQTWSQMMIAGYFVCLGLSQLIVGPLRDKYGDRVVFLVGQLIFVLGSVCCAIAGSELLFSLGRVLQGIGAASPLLVSRTLLMGAYSGAQLKNALGSMSVVASCVAIISPWFGGALATWFSWQWLAWGLAGYFVAIAMLGFYILPHNTTVVTVISLRPKKLITQYQSLVVAPQFIAIATFKWAPTFIYLTVQLYYPFALQHYFSLSPAQFGSVMMFPMSGLLIGSIVSKKLFQHLSAALVMAIFWPLLIFSGACFLFLPFTLFNALLAYGCVMVLFGGYFAIYMQLINQQFSAFAGSANALAGAVELLVFTLLAVVFNAYFIVKPIDLGWIIWGVAVCLAIAWYRLYIPCDAIRYRFNFVKHKVVRNS